MKQSRTRAARAAGVAEPAAPYAIMAPSSGRAGPVAKVSVTIDATVLRSAKQAARRSGKTLSAHISQALERDLRRQRMAELVAGFEPEHGTISAEEIARAVATWRG